MSLRCIFDCGVPLTDAEAVEHMDGSAHPDCQELAAEQADEEPEPAHPFTVQVLSRTVQVLSRPLNLPATYTWLDDSTTKVTVRRLDARTGRAFVTWDDAPNRMGSWASLRSLTFTGMAVVHHIAAEHALAGAGR